MIGKKYNTRIAFSMGSLALLIFSLNCGPDPYLYQGERLTFETPVSSKVNTIDEGISDLELDEKESSDFHFTRIGAFPLVPWGPFPLYDYYLEPIPIEVPVSPIFSLIDYIHPFYAFAGFNRFWDDDDDDRFHFRHDR
jgi:hypothetical protein